MAPFDPLDPFTWFAPAVIGTLLIILILAIVIVLILGTVFLLIGLKVVDGKHTEFGSVFVTALIMALTWYIPCLGCIIAWIVINSRHDTGFGMAIVAWIIAGLIPLIIIGGLVFFLFFPIFMFP